MSIANMIDHTMLKADATTETIRHYCQDAKKYHFASVCVNSCHVPLVAKQLEGSDVKVCCVVGFPLGAMFTSAKAFEARESVRFGADEIDMVINIGAVKDKNWDFVKEDIAQVVQAAEPALVKVIIETCLLTQEEKIKVCQLAVEAGARFVKTSTGFSTGGATVKDIELMRKAVGDKAMVKASGGIRTGDFANELINAGADRIGAGDGTLLV